MLKTTNTDTIRAAIYCRVSTDGQLDNSSPDAQLTRARAYCAERGYAVVEECIEAIGGTFVLARSEFNDLLNLAGDGRLDVLVADIPDRLGRGDAIAKCELLAQMNGARIEYAQPGRDASTVEGIALKATDQLVSGIERLNIRRRTMEGRRDWARRGRIIASPHRPFGYDYRSTYDDFGRKLSCELVVVEDEARIVRRIYGWLVDDLLTLRAIARRLNDDGVPSMKGGKWCATVLHNIVTKTVYMGEWQYGKYEMARLDTPDGVKAHRIRGREDGDAGLISVPCSAIVDEETFAAAQDQLRVNTRKFCKPTRHAYLLRGRIQCARCNGRMAGTSRRTRGKVYRSYRCWRTASVEKNGCNCPTGLLNSDLAERLAWETAIDALQHPERLLEGAKEQRREAERAGRLLRNSIAALDALDKKAAAGLDRLLDLYRDGGMTKAKYLEEKAKADKAAEKRQDERADLLARLAAATPFSDEDEAFILAFARQISNRLHPAVPFAEKARLVEALRIECVFDDRSGEFVVSGLMGKRTLSTSSGYQSRLPRPPAPPADRRRTVGSAGGVPAWP